VWPPPPPPLDPPLSLQAKAPRESPTARKPTSVVRIVIPIRRGCWVGGTMHF
jgi:hypothetical protein